MLCYGVWRLEMETNFPKKLLIHGCLGHLGSWREIGWLELRTEMSFLWHIPGSSPPAGSQPRKMDANEDPEAWLISPALTLQMPPKLLKFRATAQNRQPENVREMKANMPEMHGFILIQSHSLLSLRPESFRKDIRILSKGRRGRNHKEGTIFSL